MFVKNWITPKEKIRKAKQESQSSDCFTGLFADHSSPIADFQRMSMFQVYTNSMQGAVLPLGQHMSFLHTNCHSFFSQGVPTTLGIQPRYHLQ